MRIAACLKAVIIVLSIVSITALSSCATGTYLKRRGAEESEVKGTYMLILHGGRHLDDLMTIAILDKEGDRYTFEVYAPEYDYKVEHGISGEKALRHAEEHVSFHAHFLNSQLTKIFDISGKVIGYEVRPRYHPSTFFYSDILDVYYRLVDKRVIVYIDLKGRVKDILYRDDRLFRR